MLQVKEHSLNHSLQDPVTKTVTHNTSIENKTDICRAPAGALQISCPQDTQSAYSEEQWSKMAIRLVTWADRWSWHDFVMLGHVVASALLHILQRWEFAGTIWNECFISCCMLPNMVIHLLDLNENTARNCFHFPSVLCIYYCTI